MTPLRFVVVLAAAGSVAAAGRLWVSALTPERPAFVARAEPSRIVDERPLRIAAAPGVLEAAQAGLHSHTPPRSTVSHARPQTGGRATVSFRPSTAPGLGSETGAGHGFRQAEACARAAEAAAARPDAQASDHAADRATNHAADSHRRPRRRPRRRPLRPRRRQLRRPRRPLRRPRRRRPPSHLRDAAARLLHLRPRPGRRRPRPRAPATATATPIMSTPAPPGTGACREAP